MASEPHRFSRAAEDLIASLRRIPSEEPRASKRRASREIGEWVEALCAQHGIGRPTKEQLIRDHWREIVGGANASYSHAVRIDDRSRLAVQTTHSVVRNELFLNRAEILDRIRKLPGCSTIRGLHLSQG